ARSDEEFEEVRVACRLVVRYAEILLPPAAWYFAAKAGLRASAAPDARLVCDWVAACDGREQVRSRGGVSLWVGGARVVTPNDWPRVLREEKDAWRWSVCDALERAAPGLAGARGAGAPRRIDLADYDRLKGEVLRGAPALARAEYLVAMRTL